NLRAGMYTHQDVEFLRRVAVQLAFAINENLNYHRLETLIANRQEQENLSLLLERSPGYAIAMLDAHNRVWTWNTGARRLAGYHPEEIIGHAVAQFMTSEDLARLTANLRVAAEEGRAESEHWFVRRDGSRIWTNAVYTALRDSRGQVCRFLVVARDFTLRK